MTTRVHSDLRRLALAYYRGWIQRDKYLSIRKEYLQAITNDEVPASIDPKKIAPPPRKRPASAAAKRKSGMSWILVSTIIVALVLVALVVYMLTRPDEPIIKGDSISASVKQQTSTPSTPAGEERETDEARFITYLQENFVSQQTWDHNTLDSLKLKWLSLNQEQQDVVRQSNVFTDFSRALVEKIVDERNLHNVVPSDYELSLMTMAKNIGVINQIPE